MELFLFDLPSVDCEMQRHEVVKHRPLALNLENRGFGIGHRDFRGYFLSQATNCTLPVALLVRWSDVEGRTSTVVVCGRVVVEPSMWNW